MNFFIFVRKFETKTRITCKTSHHIGIVIAAVFLYLLGNFKLLKRQELHLDMIVNTINLKKDRVKIFNGPYSECTIFQKQTTLFIYYTGIIIQ